MEGNAVGISLSSFNGFFCPSKGDARTSYRLLRTKEGKGRELLISKLWIKIFPQRKNGSLEPFFFIDYACIDIISERNRIYSI